ncbi:flagellinolysin [Neobacillus sp.]|jgi:hypothetical protein|uniref:flagellinolysin n=1 Tax=Neobacillus sp. TaxID=2675273 RepID=UPI0035B516E8
MLNKPLIKLLILLFFFNQIGFGYLFYNPDHVSAAAMNVGSVTIKVINDLLDEQKKPKPVSEIDIKIIDTRIQDEAGNGKVMATGLTDEKGEFTTPSIPIGTYLAELKINNMIYRSPITVRASTSPTSTTIRFTPDVSHSDAKKTGSVKGTVLGADGNVLEGASLKLINNTQEWETKSDHSGDFQFFVPPGKYNLVVIGKESAGENKYKNLIYKNIAVTAGKSTLVEGLNGETLWTADEEKLSFSITEKTNLGKSFNLVGKAKENSLIEVFQKENTDYKFLYTVKTAKQKDGTFGYIAKIPKSLANETLKVRITDEAKNTYEELIDVPKLKIVWKSAAVEQGNPLVITYTDPLAQLHSKLTKIVMNPGTAQEKELEKTIDPKTPKDYSISSGKITINPNVFSQVGTYTFEFEASEEYELSNLVQDIKPSTKLAPSLSVSATTGTMGSSVQLKVSPISGNKIVVDPITPSGTVKYLQNCLCSESAVNYTVGTDYVVGASKTLAVYELNSYNQVVRYKLLTLTDSIIRIPDAGVTLESGSVSGTVKLTPTKPLDYTLKYKLSNTSTAIPKIGTVAPTNLASVSGDITINSKYLVVYGIKDGKIVAFTQYLIYPDEISTQLILERLQKIMLPNVEKLIEDYYGLKADGASLKISIDESSTKGNAIAYVRGYVDANTGKMFDQELRMNKLYFLPPDGPNGGGSAPMYNDRVIAHEMVHAVMGRTMNYNSLPTWFKEGTAEFIHGADERLKADLYNRSISQLINLIGNGTNSSWVSDSAHYSNGYLAVKYLHNRIVEHGGTGIKDVMLYLKNNPSSDLNTALKNIPNGSYAGGLNEFVSDFKANGVAFFNQKVDLNDDDTGSIVGGDANTVVPDTESSTSDLLDPLEGFTEVWINLSSTPVWVEPFRAMVWNQ